MTIVLSIIVFILIFSVLILVHEFGHFIMAKRAGIKVEEFGFGLPPRIWGKKKGETIYSINWIPFGGFVRMLGEDATDAKTLKNKRSFAAQSMRTRVKVVIAGVVMNFLLAWILLTVGFVAGMQPLLGPDDILPAVNSGLIELQEGAKIKNVRDGSKAEEIGFKEEDIIYSINGVDPDVEKLMAVGESPVAEYGVIREGRIFEIEVTEESLGDYQAVEGGLGLEFADVSPFPRVKVYEVNVDSLTYQAGMRAGDVILAVNDTQIFAVRDLEEVVRQSNFLEYQIYRNGVREEFVVELTEGRRIIISDVLPGMPAEAIGIQEGDVVISVNGVEMFDSEELIAYVAEHGEENLAYVIERNGERIFYEVKPVDGKIGVLLSELVTYSGEQDMSVYNIDLLSSVSKVNDQQYPLHVAAYKSLGESVRMAEITARMFVGVVVDLLRGGDVPDGVAGPVGIAQLTHVFVQEGFIPVLRFVAVLSLSLAVINILPFPALDGGRLFFILIEFIIGRKVNQKWEALIHFIGYGLILLLILMVTYSDILRAVGLK